ncbi:hypothetical protein [Paraburkholderia phenazinium]|nr:hypothetical protein [Paraburkholderia phenazinium]
MADFACNLDSPPDPYSFDCPASRPVANIRRACLSTLASAHEQPRR